MAVRDLEVFIAKNKEQYLEGVNTFEPNLILCDYLLPGFDGLQALSIAQATLPLVPFVFVTGTLNNEELAAQTVLSGASEFVLKNNLKRLPDVIHKVLSPTFSSLQLHNKFKNDIAKIDQFKQEIAVYEARLAEMKTQLEKVKQETKNN